MGPLRTVLTWSLGAMVPFLLVGLGVQVLLTPLFLQLEYRLPGFPSDEYGFSTEERIHWGGFGIDYLRNGEDTSFLGDLRLSDGEPLFTERELAHMKDVKQVVRSLLQVWYVLVGLLIAFGFWAWRGGWLLSFRRGLRLGGWITLGVAGISTVIGTLGATGSGELFWEFFSGFHGLFFQGDTWLFAYSDTLIRLYPLRFWQDSVLYMGVLAALGGTALAFGLREQNWASAGPSSHVRVHSKGSGMHDV